jgi:hypothetical protein
MIAPQGGLMAKSEANPDLNFQKIDGLVKKGGLVMQKPGF